MDILLFLFGSHPVLVSSSLSRLFIEKRFDLFSEEKELSTSLQVTLEEIDLYSVFKVDSQERLLQEIKGISSSEDVLSLLNSYNIEIGSISGPCLVEVTFRHIGVFCPEIGIARFFVSPRSVGYRDILSLRGFLLSCLPYLFIPLNQLIGHGIGFCMKGLGGILAGPNEAGKTTASELLTGAEILNEDIFLVSDSNNSLRIFPTPFDGHSQPDSTCKLESIFFLRKGHHFTLERIATKEVLQEAWSDYVYMFWRQILSRLPLMDVGLKHVFSSAFRLFSRVYSSTPNYLLTFPRDYIDQDQIEAVLNGTHPECGKQV